MRRRTAAAMLALSLGVACRDTRPYVVGVVLASEGEQGARLALKHVNASGGVRGRAMEARNFSGAYNSGARVALQVAESLSRDTRVVAVIGHTNSSASLAAAQVYNEQHVAQIAPTTTAPLYSQAGPYSFRLVASDEHQARFIADQVMARAGARIAIVYVNDDYGRALHMMLGGELSQRKVRPVYEGSYVEDDTANGAAELIGSIAAARPTTLVWLGRASEFRRIATRLRAALPRVEVIASDGFGGSAVESDSGGLFDRVRYVRLVDVDRADTTLQRVRGEYEKLGRGDLSDQAALAYDAVLLVAQAIREVGPDRERIRDWLARLGTDHPAYPGITGPLSFQRLGDRAPSYVLVTPGARRPAGVAH
ncbi:MAG TPA: branched-chain amino acid ABC transporter substrate-binding protein [Gemmatimonadaceae bacterium]|nr:branched-chain amino acid ABC transporter substrate-binding protein [Gemmatimonadaceae bacterium]